MAFAALLPFVVVVAGVVVVVVEMAAEEEAGTGGGGGGGGGAPFVRLERSPREAITVRNCFLSSLLHGFPALTPEDIIPSLKAFAYS